MTTASSASRAQDLLAYINSGVTPYHVVEETAKRLSRAGFRRLSENEPFVLAAGDRCFVTKNESSIIAFQVGTAPAASAGFRMIGAHTDSPGLKLKPNAPYSQNGYRQLGVEVYGGPILATWTDRDLSVAGRLSIARGKSIETRLVDLAAPALRIPNLAIHLNREVNKTGLILDPQKNLPPLFGLDGDAGALFQALARIAEVAPEEILGHDLNLYDTQKAAIGGLEQELIAAQRLDNLGSCHAAICALTDAITSGTRHTKLIVLYDHEEVGSRSAQGAEGPFLKYTLERIIEATGDTRQGLARAMASSFLVSADMAHGIHPNHADKHEPKHAPVLGKGPVIKSNVNQSYATDGASAARFALCCKENGFIPQSFVTRTDLPCGTTIGPITAAALGVPTVDVGNPMFAMHSIRETSAVEDTETMHKALTSSLILD